MEEKKVSVIVLTYKNFDKLEKNLNSIFIQNYPNIELIISDDGSENFDINDVKKIFERSRNNIVNKIIIIHKENLGIVKNFNEAIKKSSGEIIISLAGDDEFYDENVVENIVNSFGENLIVTGIREVYSEQGLLIGEKPNELERKRLERKELYKFLIYNGNIISGASTYYKKKIFEKYGYFDEKFKLLEDLPFYCMLLRNNEKIKFINKKVIKYNMGGISTVKKINQVLNTDFITLYEEEAKLNSGYDKRYLNFLSDFHKNINRKCFVNISYFKYPEILFMKILSKILKQNLYLKIFKI